MSIIIKNHNEYLDSLLKSRVDISSTFDLTTCGRRRIYFSDRLYSEDELPPEFKLFLPVQNK